MKGNEYRHFTMERDEQGVVTVVLDVQGRPINVIDAEVLTELEAIISELEVATITRVVVFRSGKPSGFLAGADVKQIFELDSIDDVNRVIVRGQQLFDRIARLLMPTVAVIHGPCLGGGLEFALACRYRIALNDSATRLGLPEIKLGLLPAWGGTQRLPRLIGPTSALPLILQGKLVPATMALQLGLVDLAPLPTEFDGTVTRFVSRLIEDGAWAIPRRLSVSAWLLNRTRIGRWFVLRTAARQVAAQSRNYPALTEAVTAVRCGLERSMPAGLERERDAFTRLLFTPTCRNLLQLFFQREWARNVATWTGGSGSKFSVPDRVKAATTNIERIGVVGAGVMGAGIAQLAAYQGFDVVLKEVGDDALKAGMSRIRGLFDEAVHRGRLSRTEANQRLETVTPTLSWGQLADADLVVEAVVEREDVKRQVFAELERRLTKTALLVSNTSSLSIKKLSGSLTHPERMAGLHFFNPVHRMELVEVVRTPATGDATIERLVQLVRRLGKTPIIVSDSPGFLVNRILFPYLTEAVVMVREGVGAETIDSQMKKFGMPMGPLELLDQVGLDVAAHVATTLASIMHEAGRTAEFLSTMVEQGHLGKKSGRGFYDYRNGRRSRVVSYEFTKRASGGSHPSVAQDNDSHSHIVASTVIEQRLVLSLVNEAARCLQEGVTETPWMVDLAMVLGTGFAPFRGGPLRLADEKGASRIIDELQDLQELYGERFVPCELLKKLAGNNTVFYEAKQTDTGGNAVGAA